MKKISKLLVLTALLLGWTLPAWSQASTQGKEFWVAMIPAKGPDSSDPTNTGQFKPYLAVSAAKACKVTLSNPNTGWKDEFDIAKNTWVERNIPLDEWYQRTIPASETVYNNGIKVQATEDVSVYCALRWSKSMDATNILPITALQSEYVVETYAPSTKDGDKRNVFTVLAAEDCSVTITPACTTEKGKAANTPFTINLKAGQVYHVISKSGESISGSHVNAEGKSIAVFAGNILGNIPTSVADRDLLYEQLFPVDYWGTDFVVTRSMEKDANRIQIVALENGTDVTIHGAHQVGPTSETIVTDNYELTLQAGETYEFELSSGYSQGKWDTNKRATLSGITVTDLSAFIHTSCPCAVFSYDVGNSYVTKTGSEEVDEKGAPSMTWVSPVQQMMRDVVFGVMGTNNTHDHFINIIVRTESVNDVKLSDKNIASEFTAVEGNAEYSYARKRLDKTEDNKPNPTYHLECEGGFIATVYGNGNDESYAYSVGSAAIKRGITIDNYTFNGGLSDHMLCLGDAFNFVPKVEGTYFVSRAIWNFGDGVEQDIKSSNENENLAETPISHPYVAPGWYDVSAILYGNKVCPAGEYEKIGDIAISFYVNRPETIHHVQYEDEGYEGAPIDTIKYDCDSVVVIHHEIIKTCMDLQIPESQQVCNGEDLEIPFSYPIGGKHGKAYLCKVIHDPSAESGYHLDTLRDQDVDIKGNVVRVDGRNVDTLTLPISTWDPGKYTVCILMEDSNCTVKNEAGEEFPTLVQSNALYITVKYPADIFAFKFNNVLAVYQNKGYEFAHYEWHLIRNGQDTIIGGDQSVYHTEEAFTPGDEYYVMLTEKGKEPIPSCTFTVPGADELDNYEPNNGGSPEDAPKANKKIVNSRICVEFDGRTYDMYGQRVK